MTLQVSRMAMLCNFLDLSSGDHAKAPWVQYYKVEEFELDPLPRTPRDPGMVAIDGELWPFAKTSVQVQAPSVISHQPSTIIHQASTISNPAISHKPSG